MRTIIFLLEKIRSSLLPCLLVSFLSVFLMAGCTTTTTTSSMGRIPSVDKEKALDNRLQLALSYLGEGNHEAARVNLKKAEKINNRSPELHDIWALLYQREMEWDEAEAHYKKALSYNPAFTRGRNNYGSFLLRLNRVDEAYNQFLKGSEDLGYSKRADLFYKVGVTALMLNKQLEAEKAFTKAIILDPQMSYAYLDLAEMAYNSEDYPKSKLFLAKYNQMKSGVDPKGLWLGIRVEDRLGNKNSVASQGMALKNLFPNSEQSKLYQNWLKDEPRN